MGRISFWLVVGALAAGASAAQRPPAGNWEGHLKRCSGCKVVQYFGFELGREHGGLVVRHLTAGLGGAYPFPQRDRPSKVGPDGRFDETIKGDLYLDSIRGRVSSSGRSSIRIRRQGPMGSDSGWLLGHARPHARQRIPDGRFTGTATNGGRVVLIVRRGGRLVKRFSIDAPDQLPPALPCDLGGGASYIEPSGNFLGYSERGRIRGHAAHGYAATFAPPPIGPSCQTHWQAHLHTSKRGRGN